MYTLFQYNFEILNIKQGCYLTQRKSIHPRRSKLIITLIYFRCRRLGEELYWQALMVPPWAELRSWACYRRLQWYDNTATWWCVHMTDSRIHPWERHRLVQHAAHFCPFLLTPHWYQCYSYNFPSRFPCRLYKNAHLTHCGGWLPVIKRNSVSVSYNMRQANV